METELEKETLMSALNRLRMNELPEPIAEDEKRVWAVGIAKVHKCDLSTNYAVVLNDGYGEPKIMQDYGHMAVITKIDEVHPSIYLEEDTMPLLRKQSDIVKYLKERNYNGDEVMQLLTSKGKTEDQVLKDRAVVQSYIIEAAIKDFHETNMI